MKTPYKKQTEPTIPIKCSESVYDRLSAFVLKKHKQKYGFLLTHTNKAITEYLDKVESQGEKKQ